MANKSANIFAQFQGHAPKTATIEALDGAEITYRTLTMAESDAFQKRSVNGFNDEGKPDINFDELTKIRYEKIALGLIEPKMTIKDLQALDSEAAKALAEIEGLISGTTGDETDEEGN